MLFLLLTVIMVLVMVAPCSAGVSDCTDHVLIIDPGHGGMDGGAVSHDGVQESAINLAVSERMLSLCRLFGFRAEMTRSSEALDYPAEETSVHAKKLWDLRRRADLVNQCSGAILLSIHQNFFPDARPSGTQVFYGGADGSREWGILLHDTLIRCLCPGNRRVAAPVSDQNYLMNSIRCPALLVECGFLSNPNEAAMLADDAYQTALAAVIIGVCLQAFN